jgi:hypothetical protein
MLTTNKEDLPFPQFDKGLNVSLTKPTATWDLAVLLHPHPIPV